jgi:serine protease Do
MDVRSHCRRVGANMDHCAKWTGTPSHGFGRRVLCDAWQGISYVAVALVAIALQLSIATAVGHADDAISPPEKLHHVFKAGVPESVDELRLMESYQRKLIPQLIRATVAVQVDSIQGSGVIINRDGTVLTAAHVAGQPGMRARITLADGRRVQGWTLGMNRTRDAGMLRLDPQIHDGQQLSWPFAPLGEEKELRTGTWCLALGHPGGYQPGREPVVRIGRVLSVDENGDITSDCKLVGGDSGGPLFDLTGTVIGIHSRIGTKLTKNVHVPVAPFRESWDRLASGEVWGNLADIVGKTVLGVYGATDSDEARIHRLMPGSPAEQAGLKPGDLVFEFDSQLVDSFSALQDLVQQHKPGDEVEIEVFRDGKQISIRLVLGGLRAAD